MPPLAKHFLIARSLATSNVAPFPIPDDFVMGHQDFTVISLAKAPLVPSRAMKAIAKKRFIFNPLCNNIAFNVYARKLPDKSELRNSMIRIGYPAIFAVLILVSIPAAAEVHLQKDGVSLSIATLADRVVFCISASGDLKVSSEYGVEFKADGPNGELWRETLPKVVTGSPYYFDLPLRIELKTRGNAPARPITVDLGACSSAANACVPITFEVSAPGESQNEPASDCSVKKAIPLLPAR